ncbi:hypothetical protein FRC10_010860 [Ceratobasidium sp. 414]|nr:hypothetical protein FRC10_010860 [Ceratobasidium sp. 414]
MKPATNAHYDSAMAAVVRRRQCTPNTRQAVLGDLRRWKDDPNGAKVYWMNGMAGTGKTTIASTLCSELEAARQLAASFFCSRELPDCRQATCIVPTISYQLARFSLPFQSALCETLGNDPDASTRSVRVQFEKLIKEPLLRVKEAISDGAVVVVDALDECSDNVSAQLFLDALYRCAGDLPIRFFVTCRPDQSFTKKILSWNQASRTLFHLHDIEQSVVRGDIEIYLRAELEELPAGHIQQLSERSGKLFIFAATVVRYIKPNDASGIWHDRLETMLQAEWSPGSKAYNSIDTLYGTILTAALSRDEFEPADVETMKRVLYTVICAKEPVTIETLAGLLDISVNMVVRVIEPLKSVLHVSEGSRLVSTLHASFPDYMVNRERSKDFFCDMGTHHHLLALRCFEVMKKLLRFNICNLESSYVLDADVPDLPARIDNVISPHLFYACSHWANHLHEAGTEEGLVALLGGFLSNSVLFWLEVLNLKKCINVGTVTLARVHKWSQTRGLAQLGSTLHSNETSALLAIWDNHDRVRSVAASSDGSCIVSNYGERFIVWDGHTGNYVLGPRNGHTKLVLSVAISPNGHTIASGSDDCTIYIWNAGNADIIAGPLKGHTGPVYSVAFSPDGARLASGSKDRTIRIWDTQTGHLLVGPFEGHTGPINSVAFSPNGGRVLSGSCDCTIRIWDAQTGHTIMDPFEGHTGPVYSVAFSPDGARIASGSGDCTIRIWDAQNGDALAGPFYEPTEILSVMFSPDSARVVLGSSGGTLSILDAHSGGVLAGPFDAYTDPIRSVIFSPDGNRVISGSIDDTICIWDVNAGSPLDIKLGTDHPPVISVAFSSDSGSIVSGFADSTFCIWNLHTGDSLACLPARHTSVDSVALMSDSAHIALGFYNGTIEIWDRESGNMLLGPLGGHTRNVRSLTFSPDGKRIASGSDDCTIFLWDLRAGNILSGPLKGHAGAVYSVAFLPDGARIASGSADNSVRIWDAQNGDMLLGPLVGHSSAVNSVGLSSDGRYLVSGSKDCTICVWDMHSGNMPTRPFLGHTRPVNSVMFSPDGSRIVSGSADFTIRIWDARNGHTLAGPFGAHGGSICSVAFSPDGSRIVSGSIFGILIWELRDSDYDVSNVAGGWIIQGDGWIIGRHSARLLWLPPALRTLRELESGPVVVHDRGPFGIDFDVAAVGPRWITCFSC